ncbi:vacuolar segregation subunit 7-domain-containing protein [Daldinia caldariorum]|uniref:vacuolar segregation subunit 7-domain-containing protein n=1 Tax=Daldinia caldariorum TaxID=326644 RepID=UPI002007EE81|nr:vacuolar segregation subunit 7-domain-containing protein [Daldinia caldariorum]KAI1468126.1 vacuolar segregation subunit 7-domain-containing protein [Daldinia caldariorum]
MANNSITMDASLSSLNSVDNDTSATSSAHIDSQASKWASASTSLTASPAQSRDTSPIRPSAKPGRTNRTPTAPSRSRKSSIQDPSPSRSRTTTPAPSTSRQQLFSAATPSLPPPSSSESVPQTSAPQKVSVASDLSKDSPRWPVSPRLKSPPPNIGRPAVAGSSLRKPEQEIPAVNVQRATPSPHVESASQSTSDNEAEESQMSSGMRTPARGPSNGSSTLETVQEVSQPNTPRPGLDAAIEKLAETAAAQLSVQSKSSTSTIKRTNSIHNATNSESGSDGGNVKSTRRTGAAGPTPSLASRQSSTTLKYGTKGPTSAESSSRNMTVETEQINNLPGLSIAPNTRNQGANASLRTKASSETIKPKKEKKKHTRKPASVTSGNGELATTLTLKLRHSCSIPSISSHHSSIYGQGSYGEDSIITQLSINSSNFTSHMTNLLTRGPRPASSKADIFEAKVASAVEEANSSDSDETFVYDSNPPDLCDRPHRYHSRTPSATSIASQVNRNGGRSVTGMVETSAPTMPIKKNMKFVNSYISSGTDGPLGDDDGRGTSRSNIGSARGTGRHHHHPNRWGRNNSSNHLSLFDNESPFPNAAKSKFGGNNSKQGSNPSSPRFGTGRGWAATSKRQMGLPGGYDIDDTTTGADDERTPLLNGGARSIRSNRSRRHPYPRNLEAQTYQRNPSFLNRFASCLVLTIMLLVVLSGALGFMFATSQPLTDIELVKIGNVLASEQELMMDVTVKAHNPNVVVVMIDTSDLEIFAKSPHAGTDSEWWRHPGPDELGTLDDPKDDPPVVKLPGEGEGDNDGKPPSEDTSPNMRLGNIVVFDSPLTYEGSFFQSGISTSTGSLRLTRPGNGTDGGSERWERIIADEFTLIVKGVLKYTLPLSQRTRNVAISGKTVVKPNSANNPSLRPNETVSAIE